MWNEWWLIALTVAAVCVAIYLVFRYRRQRNSEIHYDLRYSPARASPSPERPSNDVQSRFAVTDTELQEVELSLRQPLSELREGLREGTAKSEPIPPKVLASIAAAAVAARNASVDSEQAQQALQVHEGRLIHKMPKEMRVGVSELVEVRLGADMKIPAMAQGIVGSGLLTVHNLPVVETMAVDLFSPDGAFSIEVRSEREQLVKKDTIKGTLFESFSVPYGQWKWAVTPLRTGVKTLALRVSARVLDSQGHPSPHTLVPDKEFTVSVRVNHRVFLWKVGKWITITAPLAVLAALFSGAIQTDLWPPVKAQLIEKLDAVRAWIESVF